MEVSLRRHVAGCQPAVCVCISIKIQNFFLLFDTEFILSKLWNLLSSFFISSI